MSTVYSSFLVRIWRRRGPERELLKVRVEEIGTGRGLELVNAPANEIANALERTFGETPELAGQRLKAPVGGDR